MFGLDVAVGILRAPWDKYICWFLGTILLIYEKKKEHGYSKIAEYNLF
jgi:hypothetical protein